MAMTPEKKVKNSVVKILKEHDAYYFFPASYGMGRSGVPDVVVCHHGIFIGIECKAGKGKTTALQDRELTAIKKAGGEVIVVRETNLAELEAMLEKVEEFVSELDKLAQISGLTEEVTH